MKVILESPYAGDVEKNLAYARKCMRDSLLRGEYPLASHLLYTQEGILKDTIPQERELGIKAGLLWGREAERTVVYVDLGITPGMMQGIEDAHACGRLVIFRSLSSEEQLTITINSLILNS